MKGIVFTAFLELVEEKFGYRTVDQIIVDSNLPSKGAYTTIGTYPHQEMVQLVHHLSIQSGIPVKDLYKTYGNFLFGKFLESYAMFFDGITSAFQLFSLVNDQIHVEVKKLYPDAELPRFEVLEDTAEEMHLVYRSSRKMADFAEGLMEACLSHFGEKAVIVQEAMSEDGSMVKFKISKLPS